MRSISLATVLSTFGLIFVAELPDKTALSALLLATHFGARDVILGSWLAFLVQTFVAVVAGGALRLLPARPVHIAAGLGFLIFAVLALLREEHDEADSSTAQPVPATPVAAPAGPSAPAGTEPARRSTPPWVKCFLVVFAAEWGDLTQLATVALVARTGDPLCVSIGAVGALWSVTVIAAVAGAWMSDWLSPRVLNRASALLFAAIGLVIIGGAMR